MARSARTRTRRTAPPAPKVEPKLPPVFDGSADLGMAQRQRERLEAMEAADAADPRTAPFERSRKDDE